MSVRLTTRMTTVISPIRHSFYIQGVFIQLIVHQRVAAYYFICMYSKPDNYFPVKWGEDVFCYLKMCLDGFSVHPCLQKRQIQAIDLH